MPYDLVFRIIRLYCERNVALSSLFIETVRSLCMLGFNAVAFTLIIRFNKLLNGTETEKLVVKTSH